MVFLSQIRHHPGQMLKREKGNGVNNPHVSRSFLFQLFFLNAHTLYDRVKCAIEAVNKKQ